MPFFRHEKRKGVSAKLLKAGGMFGKDYFYKYWRKACQNLGIDGVSVYPGTKHSTTTAARFEVGMSPEEIRMELTEHKTNKAFDRYLLVDAVRQRQATAKIRGQSNNLHRPAHHLHMILNGRTIDK